MEERFRFVEEFNSGDWDMAELCRFYEIARGTGYKWVGRFEAPAISTSQTNVSIASR
jgi:transposase-like protein